MQPKPKEAFIQHYQQIQALSMTEESAEVDGDPSISISTFLSLSLFIFFFVIIFFGFIPLLLERFRDFKRFQLALVLAFVGAALPLTLGLSLQKSGFLTSAKNEEIPRNVVIFDIDSTSFRVSWETNKQQYGSLRYGTQPYSEAMTNTALEVEGLVRKAKHEVFVEDLNSETDYYFEILSGIRWYDNSGVLLNAETLPKK